MRNFVVTIMMFGEKETYNQLSMNIFKCAELAESRLGRLVNQFIEECK